MRCPGNPSVQVWHTHTHRDHISRTSTPALLCVSDSCFVPTNKANNTQNNGTTTWKYSTLSIQCRWEVWGGGGGGSWHMYTLQQDKKLQPWQVGYAQHPHAWTHIISYALLSPLLLPSTSFSAIFSLVSLFLFFLITPNSMQDKSKHGWKKENVTHKIDVLMELSLCETIGSVLQPYGRCWRARRRLDWAPSAAEGLLLSWWCTQGPDRHILMWENQRRLACLSDRISISKGSPPISSIYYPSATH